MQNRHQTPLTKPRLQGLVLMIQPQFLQNQLKKGLNLILVPKIHLLEHLINETKLPSLVQILRKNQFAALLLKRRNLIPHPKVDKSVLWVVQSVILNPLLINTAQILHQEIHEFGRLLEIGVEDQLGRDPDDVDHEAVEVFFLLYTVPVFLLVDFFDVFDKLF